MATISLSGTLSATRAKTGKGTTTSALTWAFLASVGVLVTIWYSVTPYYSDDLVYAGALAGESTDAIFSRLGTCGRVAFDWDWSWVKIQDVTVATTPRLLDLLNIFLLWLPKWVLDTLMGLAFTASIWMISRIFNYLKGNQVVRMAAMTLTMLIFLPWECSMTCFSYSKNYIWPLVLVSWIIFLLFKKKERPSSVSMFALGFLLGWIHEMVGLAVCAACVVDYWCSRDKKMLATAAGTLAPSVVMLVFGYLNRIDDSSSYLLFAAYLYGFKFATYFWLTCAPWLLLSITVSLVTAGSKKFRKHIDRLWVWLQVAAVAAGLQGGVVAYQGDRVMWYCTVFSIVLCFHILN
ncbi:MAG: DUF6056 family protein [Bacteroidales bacterium]|nr:DUF6056 family protein [Bacteroidales bacterium]